MALPTEQFLASGAGRVVDIGAGSGRAAIGLLLARPRTTVTGVDILPLAAGSSNGAIMLKTAGFEIVEQGTQPAVLYFLARKPGS